MQSMRGAESEATSEDESALGSFSPQTEHVWVCKLLNQLSLVTGCRCAIACPQDRAEVSCCLFVSRCAAGASAPEAGNRCNCTQLKSYYVCVSPFLTEDDMALCQSVFIFCITVLC